MKKFILLFLFVLTPILVFGQFYGYKVKGGAQFHYLYPTTELTSDQFSFLGRGFLNFELNKYLGLEIGAGYGRMNMTDELTFYPGTSTVTTEIIPIDVRLKITPWSKMKNVNPYLYLGAGMIRYIVKEGENSYKGEGVNVQYVRPEPPNKLNGWTGITPTAGLGLEVKLAKGLLFDIQAGYSYYATDYVNNVNWGDLNDGNINGGLGFTITGAGDSDDDRDGLLNSYEEQIGTDPENPDTDGDGLKDGDEVNKYKTNPLVKDSDNDGLNDYDEVMVYTTNPTNPDTDGDGLKDGDEVLKYKTSPLNTDTDGDGLTDYEEVMTTKTDPLKADTDDDGLNDGAEVNMYRTNPLIADTDGGSVNDGIEVTRGTNPLDPSDDVEKKPEMKVGEIVILEGVNFETNRSDITSESEQILEVSLKYMQAHPNENYEISGHTDSRGTREKNLRLSRDRAESVKNWLVNHGIDASRLTSEGYGPDQPIAPNDTQDNMYKNRRVEFKRVK